MVSHAVASPADVEVQPARRLEGDLTLPGDKSISHRALMLALLAEGESTITGAGDGADVRSTAGIVQALGAEITRAPGAASNVDYVIRSEGPAGVARPAGVLDCGNSGTSMRLFAGVLAGFPFRVTLDGDDSLRSRPMARIVHPLRAMGATIEGSVPGSAEHAPIRMRGRRPLKPIVWRTPVASAQVKSSILLAGLSADGTTSVLESVRTRDHTERMLRARGVAVRSSTFRGGEKGPHESLVEVNGPAPVQARDQVVPGDPSAAAFWLVAGAIHPAGRIRLERVGVNPTRRAAIDLLRRMGGSIEEAGEPDDGAGEPMADIEVRSSDLRSIEIEPAETAAAIDEIPVLCLAATQARGRTVIRGAGELRHKESDRIAGIVAGLSALGARISVDGDDIVIEGPTALRGSVVDSLADHRLALTFAIAGLVAGGATTVLGADSVAISYPTFFADLERIRS